MEVKISENLKDRIRPIIKEKLKYTTCTIVQTKDGVIETFHTTSENIEIEDKIFRFFL